MPLVNSRGFIAMLEEKPMPAERVTDREKPRNWERVIKNEKPIEKERVTF